jgi:hypothetical protein
LRGLVALLNPKGEPEMFTLYAKDENREDVGGYILCPPDELPKAILDLFSREGVTFIEVYEGNVT